MTYAMLRRTLAAVIVAVAAGSTRSAAQPPIVTPRAGNPIAPLDSHVTRHPKAKTSAVRMKPAAVGSRESVTIAARVPTPVPTLQRRPKAATRLAPPDR